MTIRRIQHPIDDKIPVNYVLVSVSDKSGLETLVPGLIDMNPGVVILSTGGTYKNIREKILGPTDTHLMEVSEYTDFHEMEGGLVKTIHPKLFVGILGERHNLDHQKCLQEMDGAFIDMAVVNLYPFRETVKKPDSTFEDARDNIDIGGPNMVRAAAKNFLGCASVVSPNDYGRILGEMGANGGCTTFKTRFDLAVDAFTHVEEYGIDIGRYLRGIRDAGGADLIRGEYQFAEGSR